MTFHKGNIDVTRFVALGDSITAGYTDGALCHYGQQNTYANLIATQFKHFGGGDFKQPFINPNSVGMGFSGNSCLVLKNSISSIEPTSMSLAYIATEGDSSVFTENNYETAGPFNNMGIPGSKAISIVTETYGNPANGDGNYNPFFTRMASNPATASVLSDALLVEPTFFSLFIGNNDVLAYALSGGTLDVITPLEGKPGEGFEESLHVIVNALITNGAKGAIANLPDLNSVPYFAAIPYNGLVLNEHDILLLNNKYFSRGFHFFKGRNPFVINESAENPNKIRQIKKGESILLDILFDVNKENYLKGIMPIPKKYVLINSEKLKIENTIKAYNKCIKSISEEKKLAFVDVNALLKTARTDRIYNSFLYKFNYKNGGVFSLDGLHPNAYGQVLLANEFIKAINVTYNSDIPLLDSNKFKNVVFP
jgi:lysophospholipase L1-like esterase